MHKILLMGPQGSGKGTQAQLLSEKLGIPTFAMGQLLRDEIASGSALGKKAAEFMNRGDLVTDEMAIQVLKKRLGRPDTAYGYILDGYPRNEGQYREFSFETPTHVLVIDIPREESLKRISGRLTCSTCGAIYAVKDGSKLGDECACGGKLTQRDDETPASVSRRLAIYENETKPIIETYERKGFVRRVDGMGSVGEIHKRIVDALS
ncbi:TPA: adenylate kinase [Candidatus Uhrbacteria bacterium]|nr:MAG: Adenylate kinase [Parcubacteria group bacterium GW2011_GWA2_53_21]HBL39440.1 adenylate kinase [Candidatus Uhrbacteria bacterium]